MPAELQICVGCGSALPAEEGPLHRYMISSPACWSAFGSVLAREYSDAALMAVHRLTVDAWAVQHPGDGSPRAIQSVGLHLARLMVQVEQELEGEAAHRAMLRFAARKTLLPALPPPPRFSVTVADVVGAIEPAAHEAAVRRWAASTWQDWRGQHDFIRRWAGGD